ncbi:MAG TPA: SDR family oxidoreductase [Chloroflexota bacterium]|nr:SDR family oxidoreductase [Chloroflexota bacterium]
MKQLAGRCAIVTGASRGIGAHIALALAAEGMALVLAARGAADLKERCLEIESAHPSARILGIPTDVADEAALRRLVAAALAEFDAVDLLVNNAGVETFAPFDLVERSEIDAAIRVNLLAPMLLTHQLLPDMLHRRRGHIVNVSSLAGKVGLACMETYAATKSGLLGFTQSLRATYAGSGVSASAICPGFVAEGGMYARFTEDLAHRRNGSQNGSQNGSHNADADRSRVGPPDAARSGSAARSPSFQPVPAAAVARAVVRAIKLDLPEVIVSRRPLRPLLAAAMLSPTLAERAVERLGLHRLIRDAARGARPGDPVRSI